MFLKKITTLIKSNYYTLDDMSLDDIKLLLRNFYVHFLSFLLFQCPNSYTVQIFHTVFSLLMVYYKFLDKNYKFNSLYITLPTQIFMFQCQIQSDSSPAQVAKLLCLAMGNTAGKVSKYGVFSGPYFPSLVWIWGSTE